MIEDLNDAAFNQYLKSRKYNQSSIMLCHTFLFNHIHRTCADILKIEDVREYIEQLLSRRYSSTDSKCRHYMRYLTWLQDFLRMEAAA